MKLVSVALLYLKARTISWLIDGEQSVIISSSGQYGVFYTNLATFYRGKYKPAEETVVPDTVPDSWMPNPGNPDKNN